MLTANHRRSTHRERPARSGSDTSYGLMSEDASRLRASVVVIGDEVLGGWVQDANSPWLAERLRGHGIPLERIVTVPDEPDAIVEHLAAELARPRPRVVLTSGGIGSTPDDLTMAAVAEYLQVDLITHPDLDAMIDRVLAATEERSAPLSDEQQAAVRKMAQAPAGSRVLPGATGVAPGVVVDVDGGIDVEGGAAIVVLPGIPSELRRLTDAAVAPELLAGRGRADHVVELTHPYPESALTPLLERLVADHPTVHVGSYPAKQTVVRLEGPAGDVERAAATVRARLDELADDPSAQRHASEWQARWSD